jgi:hypothetical protein
MPLESKDTLIMVGRKGEIYVQNNTRQLNCLWSFATDFIWNKLNAVIGSFERTNKTIKIFKPNIMHQTDKKLDFF